MRTLEDAMLQKLYEIEVKISERYEQSWNDLKENIEKSKIWYQEGNALQILTEQRTSWY